MSNVNTYKYVQSQFDELVFHLQNADWLLSIFIIVSPILR